MNICIRHIYIMVIFRNLHTQRESKINFNFLFFIPIFNHIYTFKFNLHHHLNPSSLHFWRFFILSSIYNHRFHCVSFTNAFISSLSFMIYIHMYIMCLHTILGRSFFRVFKSIIISAITYERFYHLIQVMSLFTFSLSLNRTEFVKSHWYHIHHFYHLQHHHQTKIIVKFKIIFLIKLKFLL